MKYRKLGKSGLRISEIALGGWLTYGGSVEETKAIPIVQAAVDKGINFIDLADIYSKGRAEEIIGRAVKDIPRSSLVLSSKLFWPMSNNVNDRGLSRKHIFESVEKSLKRIGTDYLDIYYCHRYDPETELEETIRAMDELVHQGKILYWGTSVWSGTQIEYAVEISDYYKAYKPSAEQPCYNMLDRHIEEDILPTCARYGMGLTVWSPLAQGLLTGKYNDSPPPGSRGAETRWLKDDMTNDNIEKCRKLQKIADDMGVKLSQLALAWILTHEEISCVITGATNVEQLNENVIASDLELSDDIMKAIDKII